MKDIVLFGIQGSGKGTQGKILANNHQCAYFEMGGELRTLAEENSLLGKKVKSIIDAGHLVPNEVVMEIVEHFITKLPDGTAAVIDGIPRSAEQADSFDAVMNKLGRPFLGILIELSREAALDRLLKRRLCSQCKKMFIADYQKQTCDACGGTLIKRADDTRESIEIRLTTFERETMPIIERYKKAGKMIIVNGDQPIEKITRDLTQELTQKLHDA